MAGQRRCSASKCPSVLLPQIVHWTIHLLIYMLSASATAAAGMTFDEVAEARLEPGKTSPSAGRGTIERALRKEVKAKPLRRRARA